MKNINDCYIIEFGDSIDQIRYLLDIGCNVYVYLEHYRHMYKLVYKNHNYIATNLDWVLSNVSRGYKYDDNKWLNIIKTAGSIFINEND